MHALSCVQLFGAPRTAACPAPLPMGYSRIWQEHWDGLPFPYSRGFPDPGIKPMFPVSPEFAGVFFITEPPGKPDKTVITKIIVLK